MRLQLCHLAWLAHVNLVLGARYADNRRPAIKDTPQVAANFPDVEDVELFSPAFIDHSSVPEGFTDNQVGPTSQKLLGTSHKCDITIRVETTMLTRNRIIPTQFGQEESMVPLPNPRFHLRRRPFPALRIPDKRQGSGK